MPAYPRHEIVADDEMGIYRCIARCVRRAFLCGVDPVTGKNNDHRKEWIRARLEQLASFFAVEVCGYAVLSNWAADGQALQRVLGNLSWKRSLARPAVEFPNSPDYPYFVPGRLQAFDCRPASPAETQHQYALCQSSTPSLEAQA